MNPIKDKDLPDNYSANPALQVCSDTNQPTIDLTMPVEHAGLRLDQALAKLLPNWSRNRLQTWITDQRITLDGQAATAKQKVWGNERIQIIPQEIVTESVHIAEDIKLDIIYEDDSIIVINKPVGMVVHPGNGNWQGTMLNALLHHAPTLAHIPRAGIVHRLDKETSGLLVVAKTLEAQTSLVRQLQAHSVKREYLALVLGEIECSGCVDTAIGRHPTQRTKMAVSMKGKPARTHYYPIEYFIGCTLLQCNLETGRTHQIRVHMQSIGHPLVGDPIYGGKPKKTQQEVGQLLINFPRQALHAQKLALNHPQTKQLMQWESILPSDLHQLFESLRTYT